MSRKEFEAAAAAAAEVLGTVQAKDLAGLLAQGRGLTHALQVLQAPAASQAIAAVYEAAARQGVAHPEAAAYLRGYLAGRSRQRDEVQVRTVWSGSPTPGVPVRATAQVLIEVVSQARSELLAMTYAARPYPALTDALNAAVARGVDVHIVVETLGGAAGLLQGPEPAAAFAAVPGARLWHWDAAAREHRGARQHAKLAVADRQLLFLGSANLTEAGAHRNLEAGALIRGGTAPQRAAEHIRDLQRRRILSPLAAPERD